MSDQAHDLVGHGLGSQASRAADDEAERQVVDSARASCARLAIIVDQGKSILVAVPERIRRSRPPAGFDSTASKTSLTNASSGGTDRKLTDNRSPRAPSLPAQPADELRGLVEQRDFRVAEPVNRLLAVADDEDGRRQRVGRRAQSFAPAPDQLLDQLPLRAAGVLELVDEHVMVAGFEPVSAARELVHLLQQVDGVLEHAGEIEQRARVERPLVLRDRDRRTCATRRATTRTFRSRRNARTASAIAGASAAAASRWRFQAAAESQSAAAKPVPANRSPRGLPSCVRK